MALPEIKTILYTTSLGKHTRPVFKHAILLAQQLQARIIMLHVVEPMGEMGHALIQNYVSEELIKKMHDEGIDTIKQQMAQRVEAFCKDELNHLANSVHPVIEFQVEEGNHTDVILSQITKQKADLVVMGAENTFGHHSQTTQQVMRKAKVPVYVVPTGKAYS